MGKKHSFLAHLRLSRKRVITTCIVCSHSLLVVETTLGGRPDDCCKRISNMNTSQLMRRRRRVQSTRNVFGHALDASLLCKRRLRMHLLSKEKQFVGAVDCTPSAPSVCPVRTSNRLCGVYGINKYSRSLPSGGVHGGKSRTAQPPPRLCSSCSHSSLVFAGNYTGGPVGVTPYLRDNSLGGRVG